MICLSVLRTFVLDKVSDFIMFISKLMVTGAVGKERKQLLFSWSERVRGEITKHLHSWLERGRVVLLIKEGVGKESKGKKSFVFLIKEGKKKTTKDNFCSLGQRG